MYYSKQRIKYIPLLLQARHKIANLHSSKELIKQRLGHMILFFVKTYISTKKENVKQMATKRIFFHERENTSSVRKDESIIR